MSFLSSLYRRVRTHDVLRHSVLVFAAFTLGNIALFLFHVIVSRKLGVNEYGSLYAVLSLITLASLPAGIFTTVVSKFAAEFKALNDPAHVRALAITIGKLFSVVVIVYAVFGLALGVPVAHFLRVPTWAVAIAALTSGFTILVASLRSISQGTQDFKGFTAAVMIDAWAKVVLGGVLTIAGFGLAGALNGFLVATILGGLFVLWRLWFQYRSASVIDFRVHWGRVLETTMGAASLTVSTAILSYADVLVVKHFFNEHEAGIYAAASLAGKILFFLVNFAPLVLIPKAVDRHSRGENPLAALRGALSIVGALSAAGLLIFTIGAGIVLRLLVGGSFSAAAPLLPWYALAMSLLAVTNVMAAYSIALHRFAFGVPLVLIAVLEIGTISVFHPTLHSVVSVLVCGNAVAFAAVSIATIIQKK